MSEVHKLPLDPRPAMEPAPGTPVQVPAPHAAPAQAAPHMAAAHAPPVGAAKPAPAPRNWKRPVLLLVVPLLVAAASLYAYLHTGRYVSTNNAYVKADKSAISAEVSGRITAVAVRDNDRVEAGTVLFRVDDAPFTLALARAEASLAQAERDLAAQRLAYRQDLDAIELKQNNLAYARKNYDRVAGLVERKLAAISNLDDAKHALDTAQKEVELARRDAARILVDLGGDPDTPTEQHPRYMQAKAERDQAALDLAHTVVTAPYSGVVSKKPEVGDYIDRGRAVMSLVADEGMWIEANFKETDLTHMQPGQAVDIVVDTYPGRHWRGVVNSISQATGAEYALLPPQNATGNWVKVVQRVPVRVELAGDDRAPELRAGMSVTVSVDTGHRRTLAELLPSSKG